MYIVYREVFDISISKIRIRLCAPTMLYLVVLTKYNICNVFYLCQDLSGSQRFENGYRISCGSFLTNYVYLCQILNYVTGPNDGPVTCLYGHWTVLYVYTQDSYICCVAARACYVIQVQLSPGHALQLRTLSGGPQALDLWTPGPPEGHTTR